MSVGCSIDWGLTANVIGAVATVALAILAGLTAKYAYRSAKAANDTLRLEQEPVLMMTVLPGPATAELNARTVEREGHLLVHPALRVDDILGTAYLAIENLGRSPAMNVTIFLSFVASDPSEFAEPLTTELPWFIPHLAPGFRVVAAIRNDTLRVVTVTGDRARRASVATAGKSEIAQLFKAEALPISLIPSDNASTAD